MKAIRWALFAFFTIAALYCISAAYQSASYSVPAAEPFSEIYQTRAMLLMLISILMFAVGVLFFICLKRR